MMGTLTRRGFLRIAAAAPGLRAAGPPLADVKHIRLHGDRTTYCGHPRQGGLFYFGQGEIAVLHNHATVGYQKREDVQHDYYGYHARSVLLLQRSTDGGETWRGSEEVKVWNEAAPLDEREKFVLSAFTSPRQKIDLSRPDSIVLFPRTFLGPNQYGAPQMLAFGLRSPDRGRTWERVPTLLVPPPGCYSATPDNAGVIRLPDGVLAFPMRTFGARSSVDLYVSTDDGLSWTFRNRITEPRDYPALLVLKSGRLQCYNYPLGMCYSDDSGKTWSRRKPLVPAAPSPWLRDDPFYHDELAHRSPAPLLLADGRIVLLFARRISAKRGIGLMVSEDNGASWTPDLILRDDASMYQMTKVRGISTEYSDIGYPLACQFEDGRIFTAYYFMLQDGTQFGGARFVAGTYFRLS
jgi:hypothetical protein